MAAKVIKHPKNLALFRPKAEKTINICTGIATLLGLWPTPFYDTLFIIITQVVMLKKLTGRYERSLGFSLLPILLLAMIGPELFKALLKLIPIFGSIAGALIAGSCTWLVGRSVLEVLEAGQDFTFRELSDGFSEIFQDKETTD